ncbi:MAG: DUF512 domain-containing protein [Oscillospiraceae bacterium]|nr:DUF512 domain-containing protein [Oscillospiraceae bacterium]
MFALPVVIDSVKKGSIFEKAGVRTGDTLLSVNRNAIFDVLDYQFYCDDARLTFSVKRQDGKTVSVFAPKRAQGDIGFQTYLMDSHQRCRNRCVFCFVDQMPEGLRKSLYFKDDDSRLSFLFGNYITLTAISEREVDRIIKMHISPVNISVHTMNPELRAWMMGNRHAGRALSILHRFAEADIGMNTQLVLCPGINDGQELYYSLEELSKLYPAVQSIAAIPVGLTKFRENLPELRPYTKETARDVIRTVDEFNAHFSYFNKKNLAYAADEFYLKAELPMPGTDYYDGFPQLDNGVGLCALLKEEFFAALADLQAEETPAAKTLSLITGEAAYDLMRELTGAFLQRFPQADITVLRIKNRFFGENVTVAGLLTGKDILEQCRKKIKGGTVLIPSVMLKSQSEQIFLDDITLDELQKEFGAAIVPVPNDGYQLLDALMGKEGAS